MGTSELTIILVLICGMTLLGLAAIVGGFLHYRRERILTHQERMKALELGRELPDDAATARIKATFGVGSSDDEGGSQSLARKCFSTALWVGFWGFLAASQGGWVHTGIAVAIAGSVGAIGVTAMICGTILAMRMPSAPPPGVATKSVIESDAFDVVSSRG
jgi:hypothetical protein